MAKQVKAATTAQTTTPASENTAAQTTAPLTVSDMLVLDMTQVRNLGGLYGNLEAFENSDVTLMNIECVIGKTTKKPHFRTTKQKGVNGKIVESKVYLPPAAAYYCAATAGLLFDENDEAITWKTFARAYERGEQMQMKIQSMGFDAKVHVIRQGDRCSVLIAD